MTTATVAGHRIEFVALGEVRFADRNPRRHQLDRLKLSLRRFGFAAPALRDERTGRLVAGHGRTLALRELHAEDPASPPYGVRVDAAGRWLVPVVCGWASADDAQAMAYLVADNRHGELSGWDNDELTAMLEQIRDNDSGGDMLLLHAAGYTDAELADMVKLAAPPDLDDFAEGLGAPEPSDMWPTVSVGKVPPHVAAAWREHLDSHGGDGPAGFAALLGVPVEAATVAWTP